MRTDEELTFNTKQEWLHQRGQWMHESDELNYSLSDFIHIMQNPSTRTTEIGNIVSSLKAQLDNIKEERKRCLELNPQFYI